MSRDECAAASPFSALEQLQARHIEALEAERDRYKAALERIADTGYYKKHEPYSAESLRLGFEIAREALNG